MGNYRNFKLVVYFVAAGTASETREKLEKELAFFGRHMKLDKVYLEPFRGNVFASHEQVELCKAVFEEHGIEVAGGITTTIPTPEGDAPKARMFNTFCYNDEKMVEKLKEVSTFLGKHFDAFIIDDFYFTNCTCDLCRAGRDAYNKEHGITDGSWQEYRLALMKKVSQEYMIAPAKAQNPNCKITIKYPNWAESYQETGYNPKAQRELFDMVYTGTEARDPFVQDQHLPRYLSYSLMTYFENMCPGRNGGGWFDPYDLYVTEHYLEQAYLTAFSKPQEMMMFCFQSLVDTMNVPALGYQLEKLDRVLDDAGKPVGIMCYLPDNCQGEDNVQDFLGMCGLPIVCTPYFPENAPYIFLSRSAAYDADVVEKLEKYVAKGGKALVTAGFVEATQDKGIKQMTSIRFHGRKVLANDYLVEMKNGPGRPLVYPHAREKVLVQVPEIRNNATWSLVKTQVGQESFGMFVRDTYGKGELWTLAVPDAYSQLYQLPDEVLTRIRAEFPVNNVYLEGGSEISLFMYDNDTFIFYPYVEHGVQPRDCKIHVAGDVEALVIPAENNREVKPLYKQYGETVFEWKAMPGRYTLFKIKK